MSAKDITYNVSLGAHE